MQGVAEPVSCVLGDKRKCAAESEGGDALGLVLAGFTHQYDFNLRNMQSLTLNIRIKDDFLHKRAYK